VTFSISFDTDVSAEGAANCQMHMLSFMQDCEAQTAYKTALDVAAYRQASADDSLVDWLLYCT